MSDSCKTKYPLVLIHGTGIRDMKRLNAWGRIPGRLSARGSRIYYGHQDSWATVENNAALLKKSVEAALSDCGAEKVNLIAHSKGGLEARYLISSLGMSERIASLTTVATPHRGSAVMDRICRLPSFLFRLTGAAANLWFRLTGDRKPDFHAVCRQFTTGYAAAFNEANPDAPGVYYQSYAGVMRHSLSDPFLTLPHFVIRLTEGESDGLVTPRSARWGHFRGVLRGGARRGVSHADEVDLRRRPISRKAGTGGVGDICDVYIQIVEDLKRMGF